MLDIIKEYQSWLVENNDFYHKIKSHKSSLYTRFYPIYEVLQYLYNEYKDEEFDEDIEKIFQVGLEYINLQFFNCKIYLEKTFDNDFHEFLKYDQVINYLLFIEDLKYELSEQKINYDKEALDTLVNELDEFIIEKKKVPNTLNVYVDAKITKIIDIDNYNFNSIIDIFVEIGNTLGLDFEKEEDIIIGKDI
ncbi:MAG: hypothetical protein K9L64_04520 [Candidatus Izimaplasma sp.]|nr:hypothetical protein [Candidatus Izimaplasma bacterium]